MKKLIFTFLGISIIISCTNTENPEAIDDLEKNAGNGTIDSAKIEAQGNIAMDSSLHFQDSIYDSTLIRLQTLMSQFPEFKDYQIDNTNPDYHISGDFFGDGTMDIAILMKKSKGTKIGIIDYGNDTLLKFLGIGLDSIGGDDYSWVGVFKSTEVGDTLWSNYEDDYRDFDEVPINEKVILPYNSIYAHALESCGGGFIFWKDNKWNWLQQE